MAEDSLTAHIGRHSLEQHLVESKYILAQSSLKKQSLLSFPHPQWEYLIIAFSLKFRTAPLSWGLSHKRLTKSRQAPLYPCVPWQRFSTLRVCSKSKRCFCSLLMIFPSCFWLTKRGLVVLCYRLCPGTSGSPGRAHTELCNSGSPWESCRHTELEPVDIEYCIYCAHIMRRKHMFNHTCAQNICLQQWNIEVPQGSALSFVTAANSFLSPLGHIFLLGLTFHSLQ